MSFKATLLPQQLKQLRVTLVFLGKIGSELLFEALPEQLILRSINPSRSAYAAIKYPSSFFESYNIFDSKVVQAGILMKQVLGVFRMQKITKVEMELLLRSVKLRITVHCENGLRKEYDIPCMDTEILQASVDKDTFPTSVVAEAGALNRLLGSFQLNLDEITIVAFPETQSLAAQPSKAVQIHSFVDPTKAHADKALHTQLSVDTHHVFLSYRHGSEESSDVTFNLKDFKTMLALCEGLGANIALYFDQPGGPLLVEPYMAGIEDLEFEAVLVLATLMESQAAAILQQQEAAGAATALRKSNPAGVLGARSPANVPGDTPMANGSAHRTPAAGRTPHVTPLPPRFDARTTARPSRFAPPPSEPRGGAGGGGGGGWAQAEERPAARYQPDDAQAVAGSRAWAAEGAVALATNGFAAGGFEREQTGSGAKIPHSSMAWVGSAADTTPGARDRLPNRGAIPSFLDDAALFGEDDTARHDPGASHNENAGYPGNWNPAREREPRAGVPSSGRGEEAASLLDWGLRRDGGRDLPREASPRGGEGEEDDWGPYDGHRGGGEGRGGAFGDAAEPAVPEDPYQYRSTDHKIGEAFLRSRYMAARMQNDDDDDEEEDALPGTPPE